MVGATYGEDAAVVAWGDRCLVLAMDPVTMSARPGKIVVQINANDIAVCGAKPRWLLAAVLLPTDSGEAQARQVMDDLRHSCAQHGVSLIGGHTEISPSVNQPIVTGCMIGEVDKDRLVTSSGAKPGDMLLLAGPIAVEGTGILGSEYAAVLAAHGVAGDSIAAASALLERPGISIVPMVDALLSVTTPHAMHDPTEGGVLSALGEMLGASGLGAHIEADCIPILAPCQEICAALHLDPLRLLASGSLLAAIDPGDVGAVQGALRDGGFETAVLGAVLPASEGRFIIQNGERSPLPEVERDELARFVEGLS